MNKERLNAFSDGVIAIIITIMVLERTIISHHGRGGTLARAVGHDLKAKISPAIYLTAIGVAFVAPWVSALLYASVALMWVIPDRRIEKAIAAADGRGRG